ncbi:uncharacterized protein [Littorina saxatilis]|uniref:uncharacterized protein isoform X1 n=3 Tax=Littorina saxatilis TaxID=31220 RepID=UPI0038B482C3
MLSQLSLRPWHNTAVWLCWRTSSRFELSIPLCFASTMRYRLSLFCPVLFLFILSIATETCFNPRPANASYQADSLVSFESPTDVSCRFEGDLCHYSQGCVDSGMSNWSTNNGYASVSQSISNKGASVYSVLESPWVKLSKPTCVEFTYSRGLPYQLQVFLAFRNVEQPCLMENSTDVADNVTHTARLNIEPMTIKIQFRVKGGGAGQEVPPPKLYPIKVLEGNCSQKVTSFDGDIDNNAAAIAGVVTVAVVVVFIFIIIIIVVMFRRRKRKQREGSGSGEIRPPARTQTLGLNSESGTQTLRLCVMPVTQRTDNSSTAHAQGMSGRRDPSRSSDASNYYLTPLNVYDGLTNRNLEEHAYADTCMTNQNNTYEVLSQDRGDNRPYDSLAARITAELTEQGASACSEYYNTVSPLGWGSSSSKQAPATSNGSDYQNI